MVRGGCGWVCVREGVRLSVRECVRVYANERVCVSVSVFDYVKVSQCSVAEVMRECACIRA